MPSAAEKDTAPCPEYIPRPAIAEQQIAFDASAGQISIS